MELKNPTAVFLWSPDGVHPLQNAVPVKAKRRHGGLSQGADPRVAAGIAVLQSNVHLTCVVVVGQIMLVRGIGKAGRV